MLLDKKLKLMILIKNNKKKCLVWYHHLEIEIFIESPQITMELTRNEKFKPQNELNDDVLTVVGRPGTKMKDWAMEYFDK